jgi:hypothetical protein
MLEPIDGLVLRYYGPFRHPAWPVPDTRGSAVEALTPPHRASRVDSLFFGTHTITNTLVAPCAAWCCSLHAWPSAFALISQTRHPHCPFRGLARCSFSLWSMCSLMRLLHRRLRALPLPAGHASIASGWSNSCRVGYFPPTGSTCPFTAHDICGLR